MKTLLIIVTLGLGTTTFAQLQPSALPTCYDYGSKPLPLMNEAVINMKQTLPNLQKHQVFVKLKLVNYMGVLATHFGPHLHFTAALDDLNTLIEISHSADYYTTPSEADLRAGPIYICGEFSNTNVNKSPPITQFTPSATGAMIHWTHSANASGVDTGHGHPSGWIFANGKKFGVTPH